MRLSVALTLIFAFFLWLFPTDLHPDSAIDEASIKEYTVHLIGHAHIDMNWLWLWPETVEVCKNTFSTMLKFMEEYPQFRFSQSQASAYLPIEEQYPEIFRQIQERVKSGQWEITGGTWTEGDMNMASGEAIVRQILYAKRYFMEKFGVEPLICWEPDTFGHAWTIPQILAKSGIKYYYFMRCGKGEPVFWWESPDGSRVLAFNRGSYNGSINESIKDAVLDLARRYDVKDAMFVYGVGDHGGGPTRKDIEKALELGKRKDFPNVKFDTAVGFFDTLLAQKKEFPVISNELNFVFRGCYTSHSDIKKMNRTMENLLPTAETFSSLAVPFGFKYPAKEFVEAWRNTCFNQFHDILDGTAIHGSYDYSKKLFDKAYSIGDAALKGALKTLADKVNTTGAGMPIIVFNPLSWQRTESISLPLPKNLVGREISVWDAKNHEMTSQIINGQLVFTAKDVPSVGYKTFYIRAKPSKIRQTALSQEPTIENEYFKVTVDKLSGTITNIYDKKTSRNVLPPNSKAALLQVLIEDPAGMSAWNIGNIKQTFDLDKAEFVNVIAPGVIRVKHKFNKSTFMQDIILRPGVPRIDFKMTADWFEQGTSKTDGAMLKVAFPVNVKDGKAVFDIPFGSIERPSNGDEVPALKWIDLSGKDYGVSLLNDCKYGHDVKDNVMRLSLLRASDDPDPTPDQGRHEITYSLYPHAGDWRQANTPRRGFELNNPLIPIFAQRHPGNLPEEHSFLSIEPPNLIVTALKKAEDSNDLILRFYECKGEPGTARINMGLKVRAALETDLAERPLHKPALALRGREVTIPFSKWEIKTLRLELAK